MKKLALFLSVVLFFGSCSRLIVPMGALPDKRPAPYVKLKAGTTIEPKTMAVKHGKIKADGKTYKTKDVAFYSNGEFTYGNIKKHSFAKQIYVGDINVYQTISTHTTMDPHTGVMHTSTSVNNYIQKEGSDKLSYFRYKSVAKLIPSTDQGFKYLQTYKTHRMIDDIVMAGGFGMFCGGAVVAGNGIMSTSGRGTGTGVGMIFTGMGVILTGAIMNQFNHLNLKRSVAAHNGLIVKD